jgi:hypothetical protein
VASGIGWRMGSDRHRDKASDPHRASCVLSRHCPEGCRGSHSWAESRGPHSGTHDLKWPSMCSHGLCSSKRTLVTHTFLLPRNPLASALASSHTSRHGTRGRVGVANSGLLFPPDTHSTCARPRGHPLSFYHARCASLMPHLGPQSPWHTSLTCAAHGESEGIMGDRKVSRGCRVEHGGARKD